MYNVICLKWGDKYAPEYVNNLYHMVKRNMRSEFRFFCYTENPEGIIPEIETRPLIISDGSIHGWWQKLGFFQKEVPGIEGKMMFLDLDVTINDELDCFFQQPGDFNIIWEWRRYHHIEGPVNKNIPANQANYYNSSVFMMEPGKFPHVWESFLEKRPDGPEFRNMAARKAVQLMKEQGRTILHGDQDWINLQIDNANLWPKGWVGSFKYNGLDRKDPNECKIVAFHGYPDPHQAAREAGRKHLQSPWVLSTWRDDTSEVIMHETQNEATITIEDKQYKDKAWEKCVGNSLTQLNVEYVLSNMPYAGMREKIKLWHHRLERGKTLNLIENDFSSTALTPTPQDLEDLMAGGSKTFLTAEIIKLLLEQAGFVNVNFNKQDKKSSITCQKG